MLRILKSYNRPNIPLGKAATIKEALYHFGVIKESYKVINNY